MKKLIKNVTLGADPELFLTDYNGHFVSAVGLIGGSKMNPRPILDEKGSAVQEDNVAVEFNIPPAANYADFNKSIQQVLGWLTSEMSKKKLTLAYVASALFPESELKTPAAMTFGCEPDMNAWLKRENPMPVIPDEMKNLRSAGGHIHIGYENPIPRVSMDLIKLLDIFIGCPSVLLDKDKNRRRLYGQAGAFRFKEYGVEYRTPSNYWIKTPESIEFVWKQTHKAIDYYNNDGLLYEEEAWPLVDEIINRGDLTNYPVLREMFPI